MRIENHWLSQARKVPSPNYDDRPIGETLSLIVIHCISLPPEQFGGEYIDHFFCNQLNPESHSYFKEIQHLKVSSHLLIKRTGKIVQYVPFDKKAWHAGVSVFNARQKCNDFSIGIELEGSDKQAYTAEQYEKLGSICQALLNKYPSLSKKQIVGHSDISPGRKTDPGPFFKWDKFLNEI